MKNRYVLSILVPMYQEGEDVIKPLLDSISLQQNVDFDDIEVVITHDGIIPIDATYKLSEAFINSYPFKVTYFEKEHSGVSATRNYCLDNCNGKYVMFCDCDDMFYNMCGLYIVFKEIQEGFDTFISIFTEECKDAEGNITYVNHGDTTTQSADQTFVHGKIHRREFLAQKKIRWNDSLTIHEDSYFNILCQRLAKKARFCSIPFYLWKWRDNSVCRHDPKYLLRTFVNLLDSSDALITEFLNRNMEKEAIFYVTSILFETYLTLNTDKWWESEGKEYRLPTEKRFKEYWEKYKYLYEKVTKPEEILIMSSIRQRFFTEGLVHEKITLEDWLKHIEEL